MSWLAAAAVAVPVVVTKGILTVRSRGRKDSSESDRCAYHWQQVPSSSGGSRRLPCQLMHLHCTTSPVSNALTSGLAHRALLACRGDEDSPFVCERVCTSDRLLKKLGSLAKEPTRDTCVTVCGVSGNSVGSAASMTVIAAPHKCNPGATSSPALPAAHAFNLKCLFVSACELQFLMMTTCLVQPVMPPAVSCTCPCTPAAHDACTDACQRAVCSIPHQVPAWNDSCLKRCTAECLKGRAS